LQAELYNLSSSSTLAEWRQKKSDELIKRVQKQFVDMQNPADCSRAKKIVCSLNKACGFGCQMHHVMYCFITAYFTKRTMILESDNWRYNPRGYEAYFRPLSETCKELSDANERTATVGWNEPGSESAHAIKMPIIDVMANKPRYLPLAVPRPLLAELRQLHGDPFVWWSGQILSYLMRFNDEFGKQVNEYMNKLGFRTPCVGYA
jgi:glycoprotein 6-alpha-L-fucosyltransferase